MIVIVWQCLLLPRHIHSHCHFSMLYTTTPLAHDDDGAGPNPRRGKEWPPCLEAYKDEDFSVYHMPNRVYTDQGPQNLTGTLALLVLLGHCHNNSMSKLMKEGIAPIKKLLDTEKGPELFHVFLFRDERRKL